MRISILMLATFAGFAGRSAQLAPTPQFTPRALGVEILQSKEFVLLDGPGHKRGEWKIDSSGQPVLRLFDDQRARYLGHHGSASRPANASTLGDIPQATAPDRA